MAAKDSQPKPPTPRTPARSTNATRPGASSRPTGRPVPRGYDAPTMSVEGIRRGCLQSAGSKIVLALLILVFAGGVLLTSIGSNFSGIGSAGGLGGRNTGSDQTVATVAGQAITSDALNRAMDQQLAFYRQVGMNPETSQMLGQRQSALQGLTNREALIQAAHAAGFNPSGSDIDGAIQKNIDDEIKSQSGDNPAAFRRQIEARYPSVDAYREELRQRLQANRDDIGKQWSIDQLEAKTKAENHVTEADYQRSITKIHLYQILVRPRPPVTPTPRAGATPPPAAVTMANAEAAARTRAAGLVRQLGAHPTLAQFTTLAKTQSDDLITKSHGGDLGLKLPSELESLLPANIRDAVTSAANNSVVGPLQNEATREYYVLFVAPRQLQLPHDYATKKATYLHDFETQRDNEAWQKYQDDIGKGAQVEITDPALLAYRAQTTGPISVPGATGSAADNTRNDIISNYEAALGGASGQYAAAIRYQLAQLYSQVRQPQKALEALKGAVADAPDDLNIRLELARNLQANHDTAGTLAQAQELSKYLDRAPAQSPFSMGGPNPNDTVRAQVAAMYDQLGKPDLARAERAKIRPATPPGGMSGMPGLSGGAGGMPSGVHIVPSRGGAH